MKFWISDFGFWIEEKCMDARSALQVLNSCSNNLKSRIQKLKWLGLPVIAFVLAVSVAVAAAQQPRKMPLIGYLDYGAATDRDEAFFEALRDLGWVERQNIAIEYRWAEGGMDRLPVLAKELVGLKVDLIVTTAGTAVQAAKRATTTIPIVMARAADAVENGYVASLARPGGNVTGMSEDHADLHTKLLELLHETLPQVKRVAFLWNPASATYTRSFKAAQAVAPALGLTIQSLEVNHLREAELRSEKVDGVLDAAAKDRVSALVVMPAIYRILGRRIAVFATKNRMPVFSAHGQALERHFGLLAYT
jgi:putative ABC transport system substrate-binding protein